MLVTMLSVAVDVGFAIVAEADNEEWVALEAHRSSAMTLALNTVVDMFSSCGIHQCKHV